MWKETRAVRRRPCSNRLPCRREEGEKEFCTGRRSSRKRRRDAAVRRSVSEVPRWQVGAAREQRLFCAAPAWSHFSEVRASAGIRRTAGSRESFRRDRGGGV